MRKVPSNGTLSVDERNRNFQRVSAVSGRVRFEYGIGIARVNIYSTHLRTSFLQGGFFMQESAQQKKGVSPIKRLLFSATLAEKNASHKIAYISVMTDIVVVANMFFEFKFADTQFSLTIVVSALCGLIIGPLFGFAACFLGDLVGYLYHSAEFAYYQDESAKYKMR